jgi:hypothetical protein
MWMEAIELLEKGLQELEKVDAHTENEGEQLSAGLSEALRKASDALQARELARAEAKRLVLEANQANEEMRYEDAQQAYLEATGELPVPPCFADI